MKNILLINYYGIKDIYISIKKVLEHYGYIIYSYPLFKIVYDDNEENYIDKLNCFIQDNNIDIVMWFCNIVPCEVFKYIQNNNPHVYSVLFFYGNQEIEKDKCLHVELVVTSSSQSIGFDSTIFYPLNIEKDIDVSICCRDLYQDNEEQIINREKLISSIIKEKDINFHIYGPSFLKYKYPEHYKGFINYNDLNSIYNRSKINICTHSTNKEYISDKLVNMLAGNNLVLIDKPTPFENCIVIDKEEIIQQIKDIIKNYTQIITTNNVQKYKIEEWAKFIHNKICLYFFDEIFYKKLYTIPDNIVNLKYYWEKEGISFKQIPFKFKVPKEFDYTRYVKDIMNNKLCSKEYVYWYYRINSRDEKYILNFDLKNFDLKKIIENINFGRWSEINILFYKIETCKNNNIYELLDELHNVEDIDKLLNLYFYLK